MNDLRVMRRDVDEVSSVVRERILQALHGIRFGAVEIVIHDGKVVEIQRKERVRWEHE
jgi:hypothetical protein